jgi:hypothetical protein
MQKKLELNQKKLDAGFVSEKFPKVSNIVIKMTYYWTPFDTLLMLRTVNFSPKSYAYFHMQCMVEGCVEGGFELTSIVAKLIKGSEKRGKGKLVCRGKGDKLSQNHASIDYEIAVKYYKPLNEDVLTDSSDNVLIQLST